MDLDYINGLQIWLTWRLTQINTSEKIDCELSLNIILTPKVKDIFEKLWLEGENLYQQCWRSYLISLFLSELTKLLIMANFTVVLEFQGPTYGPSNSTLTFGLASLNLNKLRWGRTYKRKNKIKGGNVHTNEQTFSKGGTYIQTYTR